jgi:hypothetical protein
MTLLGELSGLKNNYFFFALVCGFCFLFLFFSRQRFKKVMAVKKESLLRKFLKLNLGFSAALLCGAFILAVLFTFSNSLYNYCIPIPQLDRTAINVTGVAIIRFSFIWLVGSAFEISRRRELVSGSFTLAKIRRVEALSLAGVVLLIFGIFVFISSLASLLLFVISLLAVYLCRKNFKRLDEKRYQQQ